MIHGDLGGQRPGQPLRWASLLSHEYLATQDWGTLTYNGRTGGQFVSGEGLLTIGERL